MTDQEERKVEAQKVDLSEKQLQIYQNKAKTYKTEVSHYKRVVERLQSEMQSVIKDKRELEQQVQKQSRR
jgi:hypothetical protein